MAARRDSMTVSLVGYTNAGKSTLLNALTGSDVLLLGLVADGDGTVGVGRVVGSGAIVLFAQVIVVGILLPLQVSLP